MNSLHLLLSTVDKALSTSSKDTVPDDEIAGEVVVIDDDQIVTRVNPQDINNQQQQQQEDNENSYYEDDYEQPTLEEKSNNFIWKLLYIIFFIPNYLIFKPIFFLLYIITYPIRIASFYLFGIENDELDLNDEAIVDVVDELDDDNMTQGEQRQWSSTGEMSNSRKNNTISTISEEDDDDLEFEISSESAILADKLKSPTSRNSTLEDDEQKLQRQQVQQVPKQLKKKPKRKKQRFVFPRLLINNNFNLHNPPLIKKKTLVLDLDETLIHSLSRHNSSVFSKSKGKMIEIKLNNQLATLYYIYKRPFVDEFFNVVKNWFDLVCFTASIKEYADPVIDFLEEDFVNNIGTKLFENNNMVNLFQKRYYRSDCIWEKNVGYIKDLSVLTGEHDTAISDDTPTKPGNRGRPLLPEEPRSLSSSRSSSRKANTASKEQMVDPARLIIIDNSPVSYSLNKENGIMIEGWINDPNDLELMNLLPLLNSLRFTSDVRAVLSLKEGESAFSEI